MTKEGQQSEIYSETLLILCQAMGKIFCPTEDRAAAEGNQGTRQRKKMRRSKNWYKGEKGRVCVHVSAQSLIVALCCAVSSPVCPLGR